jgi:TolB-like protein/DNA-binding winged helix-turn-helix (wHTH) protein/Tfp pilus assembly protein PilF
MSVCATRHRFGPFELETAARQLYKNGTKINLRGQPYLILEILLQHAGDIVSREEIRRKVWTCDTFVDFEHGLNTSIKKLRQVLCDSASEPRYIETLPRVGYRFIAPVETPADPQSRKTDGTQLVDPVPLPASKPAMPANDQSLPMLRLRAGWLRIGLVSVLLLLVALVTFRLAGKSAWLIPSRLDAGEANAAVITRPIRSIAVLPLQYLSNDPSQEYFADGMSDELITDLAQLGSLRVISRTSTIQYKGTKKIVPQIGRELGVDALIEGTVERADKRVRIRVQLIECATDRHLWSKSYNEQLGDVLALETRAAHDIVEEIQGRVIALRDDGRAVKAHVINNQAYDFYLKGRYFWNKRSPGAVRKSIALYQQAIELDPQFAASYSGLADAYMILGSDVLPASEARERAQAAADKALELDPNLPEGHATLGLLEFYYNWNWTKAEEEFREAIQLNPSYATAHQWYSGYLTAMGRFREAAQEADLASQLDPLSLAINTGLAAKYYYARQYDRAIEIDSKTLEMEPNFLPAHLALASTYEAEGDREKALREVNAALQLSHQGTPALVELGRCYARWGNAAEAERIIQKLRERSAQEFVSPFEIAEIYASLNDRDQAMHWLEKSYAQRDSRLPFLNVDARFDPVRPDPRFQDLLRRVGLAQ